MDNNTQYVTLSEIQHYMFCPRQWGLIHLEKQWEENYLTVVGELLHKRVHDSNIVDSQNGVLTIRGLDVVNESLHIYGKCDAVEFRPAGENEDYGAYLHGRKGTWIVAPVEYKKGKAKLDLSDVMQVVAQAVCLEEMFSTRIDVGYLYYKSSRRREEVFIDEENRNRLIEVVSSIKNMTRSGHTPKSKVSSKCNSCSLKDACVPSLLSKPKNVAEYINRNIGEGEQNETDA